MDDQKTNSKLADSAFPAAILFVLFGYGIFIKLEIEAHLKIFIFSLIWWVLLFSFWIHPAFCFFEIEKGWRRSINAGSRGIMKYAMLAIYYYVYWPICIPKRVCLIVFAISWAMYIYFYKFQHAIAPGKKIVANTVWAIA